MAEAGTRTTAIMTVRQRRIVRQTFEPLRELAAPVALLFYGKLFELDPGARRLFHNDLALQGRKLMDTLAAVAGALDDFDSMRPRLMQLGRQHAEYGVHLSQYDTVVTALLWAIGQALGPDFDAETREAWSLALDTLTGAMKEGARLP